MRYLPLALLVAIAGGCGGDDPSTRDGGSDGSTSLTLAECADLQSRWNAGVQGLDRACRVAGDCRLLGTPRGNTCNCTPNIFAGCGFAVARNQFPPSLDQMADQWFASCTTLVQSNICDCAPLQADCVNSRCVASQPFSCLPTFDAGAPDR